jgi:hypothetical protein
MFDVAGLLVAQSALDVITHVIWLLFAGVYTKVLFVAPDAFDPFTFH